MCIRQTAAEARFVSAACRTAEPKTEWKARTSRRALPSRTSGLSDTTQADARRRSGFKLRKVQQGLDPDDWKPMTGGVGPGVREIRIQTELVHRLFYLATFEEAVYVLRAFEKKTQKTSAQDLRIGRDRFRALKNLGQQHGKEKRG